MASKLCFSLYFVILMGNQIAAEENHGTSSEFSYPPSTAPRTATPLHSPLVIATPYAQPFSKASTLLDTDVTYTTYSLDPEATQFPDGKYGQSAFAALWANANLTYSQTVPFTTVVEPTPIPKSELIFPPELPFKPRSPVTNTSGLPANFVWGAASSAWQVEGGLELAGRGPSVLDNQGLNAGGNSSNVNAMFYYLYKQDILRLAQIGLPYLSFSIPWTRIVPFGKEGSPFNIEAIAHYEDLINTAVSNGVTPIVTILHYDLPFGTGYTNATFIDDYLYYAKQIMARFGDRVPYWITINEPNLQPVDDGLTNILLAHSKLYDWYKHDLKGKGKISMKFANNLAIPLNPSTSTTDRSEERRG